MRTWNDVCQSRRDVKETFDKIYRQCSIEPSLFFQLIILTTVRSSTPLIVYGYSIQKVLMSRLKLSLLDEYLCIHNPRLFRKSVHVA